MKRVVEQQCARFLLRPLRLPEVLGTYTKTPKAASELKALTGMQVLCELLNRSSEGPAAYHAIIPWTT